jgi:hypothetical protein
VSVSVTVLVREYAGLVAVSANVSVSVTLRANILPP